jgi:hypothetical protein
VGHRDGKIEIPLALGSVSFVLVIGFFDFFWCDDDCGGFDYGC